MTDRIGLVISPKIEDGTIKVHLNIPVVWFGLTAEGAEALALNLRVLAKELRESQGIPAVPDRRHT